MKKVIEIAVGDRVIVRKPIGRDVVTRVRRVTGTQIILPDGSRWRRSDGRPVGCGQEHVTDRIHPFPEREGGDQPRHKQEG